MAASSASLQQQHQHQHQHPPAGATTSTLPQGQLRCCGCGVTLAYPLDAPCVRCPICNAITGVNQVHIRCVRCGVCLALPPTALLARCPRCQQVMQMPRMAMQNQAAGAGGGGGGGGPLLQQGLNSNASFGNSAHISNKPIVYIENPPMRDHKGKIHTDTKIGTKLDDVW